jgi:hypothetical protein
MRRRTRGQTPARPARSPSASAASGAPSLESRISIRRRACSRLVIRVLRESAEASEDFAAAPPRTRARFALLAGSDNRCFLPSGQQRTYRWLEDGRPGAHTLHLIPGYAHMDMLFGRQADGEVYPHIVRAPAH